MTYNQFNKKITNLEEMDPNASIAYAKKILSDSSVTDQRIKDTCLFFIASDELNKGKFDKAKRNLTTLLNNYQKNPYIPAYFTSFNSLALIENFSGNNQMALFYYKEAERLAKLHHNYIYLSDIYSNVALCYKSMGQNDISIKYLEMAIEKALPNNEHLGYYYFNLANNYYEAGNYALAEADVKMANEKYKMGATWPGSFYIETAFLQIYFKEGRKEDYQAIKKAVTADIAKVKSASIIMDVVFDLAEFYLKTDQISDYEELLPRLEDFQAKCQQSQTEDNLNHLKAEYFEKKGDYQQACHFLKAQITSLKTRMKAVLTDAQASIARESEYSRLYRQNEESKIINAKLKTQAETDSLTGLLNRHAFNQAMIVHKKKLNKYSSFGCALLDIDHFKSINDNFGHLAGDNVLIQAGKLLKTFGNSQVHFYRYGGDELVGLFESMQTDEIVKTIKDFQAALNDSSFISQSDGSSFHVSASAGICNSAVPLEDILEYLNKADAALYHSKKLLSPGQLTISD
jgi:diguanylate cyclase (GGDEF)-like protein